MSAARAWFVWAVCIACGILLGLGLYTFRYAEGLSYLSNDPKACMNCHIMREHYDSWVKTSHHAVATCNDCHVPHTIPAKFLVKADNGWHHSRAFTLQNFEEPIRIRPSNLKVLQRNCLHCHEGMVHAIVSPQDVRKGDLRCTECHRSAGHMKLD